MESREGDMLASEQSDSAIVVNTILERRSIRAYKDTPVERQKLETIVNCGINAPSGMNQQPWEVRVVQDSAFIAELTEIFAAKNPERAQGEGFKNMFRNAPALIFIATPRDGKGLVDCGLITENMVLAATAMGLGTCIQGGPIAFLKDTPDCNPYLQRLEISADYELQLVIGVGYADEAPEAKPRDASKVKWIE